MLFILQWLFFAASILVAFYIWVLPVLRQRPELKELFDETDSFREAVKLRFQGIKGKLVAGFGMAGSALYYVWDQAIPWVVQLWDSAVPVAMQIDWTPVQAKVPGWLVPVILFGMFWLISKFRAMTDKRAAAGN